MTLCIPRARRIAKWRAAAGVVDFSEAKTRHPSINQNDTFFLTVEREAGKPVSRPRRGGWGGNLKGKSGGDGRNGNP